LYIRESKNKAELVFFQKLYKQYHHLLLHCSFRILHDTHLAQDAVQEAYIRINNNLHKIDGVENARTRNYLVLICSNVAKDIYNTRKQLITSDDELFDEDYTAGDNDANPLDIVIRQENLQLIVKTAKQLPDIYRDIFVLKFTYDCTNDEICNLLNISTAALKKRQTRLHNKLKRVLMREGLK